MANIYLKNGATPAAPYGSWAAAAGTLTDAVVQETTGGDTIYVASTHTETTGSARTYTLEGSFTTPTRIICVTEATPPATVSTGALVITSGASGITIRGVVAVIGMTFRAGSSSNLATFTIGNDDGSHVYMENCNIEMVATSTSNRIIMGSSVAGEESRIHLKDCTLKFAGTTQGMSTGRHCNFTMTGGSTVGSALANLMASNGYAGVMLFEGVDFSSLSSSCVLFSGAYAGTITFRNCRLPSGWSGTLTTGVPSTTAASIAMYNCDDGDTNYTFWTQTTFGSVREYTGTYRDAGAFNGGTHFSWKMESSIWASFPLGPLESPEIVFWNETVGTVSFIVLFLTDGVQLYDNEIWIEAQFLGTSASTQSTTESTRLSNVIGSAQTVDPDTNYSWTDDIATPQRYGLPLSITVAEKGFIHVKVFLAKTSTVVYVDPKPESF